MNKKLYYFGPSNIFSQDPPLLNPDNYAEPMPTTVIFHTSFNTTKPFQFFLV